MFQRWIQAKVFRLCVVQYQVLQSWKLVRFVEMWIVIPDTKFPEGFSTKFGKKFEQMVLKFRTYCDPPFNWFDHVTQVLEECWSNFCWYCVFVTVTAMRFFNSNGSEPELQRHCTFQEAFARICCIGKVLYAIQPSKNISNAIIIQNIEDIFWCWDLWMTKKLWINPRTIEEKFKKYLRNPFLRNRLLNIVPQWIL